MLPLGHRSLTDYHTSPARISIYTRLRQTHRMCNNEQRGKAPRALTSQSPVNGTRKFSLVKIERAGQDAVHNQRLSRPSHAGPQGESTATLTRDSTGRPNMQSRVNSARFYYAARSPPQMFMTTLARYLLRRITLPLHTYFTLVQSHIS